MFGRKKKTKKATVADIEHGALLRISPRKDLFVEWVADSLTRCEMLRVLSEEQRREIARRVIEDFHRRNWGLINLEFAEISDKDIAITKVPVD